MGQVVQFPTLPAAAMRGCSYTPARRVTLVTLSGEPFADALVQRAEQWDWIVEATCEAMRCYPEEVDCDDDTVTVRGVAAFLICR